MSTAINELEVEHQINKLTRDYRNVRQAVFNLVPDNYTIIMIEQLGRTIAETKRMLLDIFDECNS
jgi:hypothetical protein